MTRKWPNKNEGYSQLHKILSRIWRGVEFCVAFGNCKRFFCCDIKSCPTAICGDRGSTVVKVLCYRSISLG